MGCAGPKARMAEIGVESSQIKYAHAARGRIWLKSLILADGRLLLPVTSPTPPITAAAKQQHQNDDDEDQFHNKSP